MGSSISKIKYKNITNITDFYNNNSKKPYNHTIYYKNGKTCNLSLTKENEEIFQIYLKMTKLLLEVAKIKFLNITDIKLYKVTETEPKYHFSIIYNTGFVESVNYITEQNNFFWKMYNKINKNPKKI